MNVCFHQNVNSQQWKKIIKTAANCTINFKTAYLSAPTEKYTDMGKLLRQQERRVNVVEAN